MPRKVAADLATMQTEIDATEIALEVDAQAAPFVGATQGFDEGLAALAQRAREVAQGRLRVQVTRDHLNRQLDPSCLDFVADLLHYAKGDRSHPEYKVHLSVAPSVFIRKDFDDQVGEVKRWLILDHPTAAPYKAQWAQVVARAEALVVMHAELDKAVLALRADLEAAATRLTAQRDALHRRLGDHAEAIGLDRTWADGFFLRG